MHACIAQILLVCVRSKMQEAARTHSEPPAGGDRVTGRHMVHNEPEKREKRVSADPQTLEPLFFWLFATVPPP